MRCSKAAYNSPICCVPKKGGGGLRIIQDFRGLNSKTHTGRYSMKEVNECNSNIGRANSTIFSILDLTSGFCQMPIAKKGSHLMAFTEQGQGHSKLVTSPMGFLGCPASFQCLIEKALEGIKNSHWRHFSRQIDNCLKLLNQCSGSNCKQLINMNKRLGSS